jgi:predicted nucleic acid binding AN1-type Zn finger protein
VGILASIIAFFSKIAGKEKTPVHANCSFCGEWVYLPFHCDYCNQYFCGTHRLPFEHDCKNINEWKKKPGSEGTAVESKAGKMFVRK